MREDTACCTAIVTIGPGSGTPNGRNRARQRSAPTSRRAARNGHEQAVRKMRPKQQSYLGFAAVAKQRRAQMGVPAQQLPNLLRTERCARLLLLLMLVLLLLHQSRGYGKQIVRCLFQIVGARLQLQRPQPGQHRSFEGRDAAGDAARELPYFKKQRRTNTGCAARENAAVVVEKGADVACPRHSLLQPGHCVSGAAPTEGASNARADKSAKNNASTPKRNDAAARTRRCNSRRGESEQARNHPQQCRSSRIECTTRRVIRAENSISRDQLTSWTIPWIDANAAESSALDMVFTRI